MSNNWHVYMLRCADGSLYTGVTTDIKRRVAEHNTSKKGSACVRGRRPVKIVYRENFTDRSSALKREAAIKAMTKKQKEELVSKGLENIPGVGRKLARALRETGVVSISDLSGADPEQLYSRLMKSRGRHIDRCVLYVFRCAVYYASNTSHDPELLKWWNWKDRSHRG